MVIWAMHFMQVMQIIQVIHVKRVTEVCVVCVMPFCFSFCLAIVALSKAVWAECQTLSFLFKSCSPPTGQASLLHFFVWAPSLTYVYTSLYSVLNKHIFIRGLKRKQRAESRNVCSVYIWGLIHVFDLHFCSCVSKKISKHIWELKSFANFENINLASIL